MTKEQKKPVPVGQTLAITTKRPRSTRPDLRIVMIRHPGVAVLEEMTDRKIGIPAMVLLTEIDQSELEKILAGKERMMTKHCAAIGHALNVDPDFFLTMQIAYDDARRIETLNAGH